MSRRAVEIAAAPWVSAPAPRSRSPPAPRPQPRPWSIAPCSCHNLGRAELLRSVRDRCRDAARVVPNIRSKRDEIGAGLGERTDLRERRRKADAGHLEYLGPPGDAIEDRVERRAPAVARLTEHHV